MTIYRRQGTALCAGKGSQRAGGKGGPTDCGDLLNAGQATACGDGSGSGSGSGSRRGQKQ